MKNRKETNEKERNGVGEDKSHRRWGGMFAHVCGCRK